MWGPVSPLGGSSVPWSRTEESDKVLSPGNTDEIWWLYKTPWTPPERPKFINSLWEKQLHRRVAMTCLLYDTLWIARPAKPCSFHPQHPGRWLTALTACSLHSETLGCGRGESWPVSSAGWHPADTPPRPSVSAGTPSHSLWCTEIRCPGEKGKTGRKKECYSLNCTMWSVFYNLI